MNLRDKIISQYAYKKNEQPKKQIAVFQSRGLQSQVDVIDGFFVLEPPENMVDQQFYVKSPFAFKNKGALALALSLHQKRRFLVCSHGMQLFSCGLSCDFPTKQEVLQ